MIQIFTQYRVCCDVAGCRSASGLRNGPEAIIKEAKLLGWESRLVPGSPNELFRCHKCCNLGKKPELWDELKESANG